jgi:peptide/nickel transport system permease protein
MKSLRRAARNTVVMIGAVFALAIVVMALFAGVLAATAPDEQNFDLIEAKPGAQALFGTDRFGRDVLSRVIYGTRVSLYVAATSIGLAMVVGGALGLTAGYVGGLWDNAITLVTDAVTRKTGDPFGPPASSSIAPARVIGSGDSAPS